jgi:hypothetical protein
MGGGASTTVKVSSTGFEAQHAYQQWPFAAVENAFDNAKQIGLTHFKKCDFFNTFVDFTVYVGDDFLRLPLAEFERLSLDKKEVDTRHVFLLLCLLCDGSFDERMKLLFRMLDENGNNEIGPEEMVEMVELLIDGLKTIKWVEEGEIDPKLLLKAMKEKSLDDGIGAISEEEFVSWAVADEMSQGPISELYVAPPRQKG